MRPIALVGLYLIHLGLAAQAYIPLLTPSATWQDENEWASPGPNSTGYECRRYFLDGDTVVEGTEYRILRQTGRVIQTNYVYPNQNSSHWFGGEFVGLLREDTTERRVYIRPSGWPMDWLLYDFSVGLGPYPATYRYYQSPDLEVIEVDTVMLTDGPHRRLRFHAYEAIIEGVGGTSGFLESWLGGEIHTLGRLVCHTVDGTSNYEEYSNNCACGADVGVPTRHDIDLGVSPSPTMDFCHLKGAPPNAPYLVRSMAGRVIRAGMCSTSGAATIDLADLPPAMYLLMVQGATRVFKIIKQ